MRVHGNVSEGTWYYSQITGEEGMISATMDTRGGVRKRVYVHKIRKRGGFSKVKCILISILSEGPFLNEVHFK